MTDKPTLRECPFCGESNAVICQTSYLDTQAFAVSCRTRDCHGAIFSLGCGQFSTEAEAITAWNHRIETLSQQPGTQAVEWLTKNAETIKAAVAGWHRTNSAALSEWMREDERDWRADLELHLAALSTPPKGEIEAIREALGWLLPMAQDAFVYSRMIHGGGDEDELKAIQAAMAEKIELAKLFPSLKGR